jgi:hypothetical protein
MSDCRACWAGFHGPGVAICWSSRLFRLVSRWDGLQAGHRYGDLADPEPSFGVGAAVGALRASRPATAKIRSPSCFGSQRRVVRSGRASGSRPAVRRARRLCPTRAGSAKPFSGRCRSLVSSTPWIRSSHPARRRCSSSRSASWLRFALVAKAMNRCVDVGEPQLGARVRAFLANDNPRQAGQDERSSRQVMTATQAPSPIGGPRH